MKAYNASSEEALRARDLLKDWAGEDFLAGEQYKQMEQETVCDLRRTNIFLRIVLFIFTLIMAGAGGGLFFVIFLQHASDHTTGVFLLFFAAASYAAAEGVVAQARLYRFGIEEALAVLSIGSLCVGIALASGSHESEYLIPSAGAVASLWIWRRFGLPYTFFAAMVFAAWLATYWTSSHTAQHLTAAGLYAAGLMAVAAVRPRYRLTYLNGEYSIAEALLWLGIYLAINLQLSSIPASPFGRGWGGPQPDEFSRSFYWTTWVLTWCLPAVVLARGLRVKDRFVIAVGGIVALLTLITNKSYLGWQRHTWDPMLLGILLAGVALLIRRWLAHGPDGVRNGFTAHRLSGKDKRWMSAGTAAFSLVSPNMITPSPQTSGPDVQFGGGDSGGGGASSDF